HPGALSGERGTQLSCQQVICLTEAITPISDKMPWLWVAIKQINSIRNDLAHQLSPKDLGKKIESLTRYVRENSPEVERISKEFGIDPDQELVVIFVAMCTCLAALKAALSEGI